MSKSTQLRLRFPSLRKWVCSLSGSIKITLLVLLSFFTINTNAQIVINGQPGDWCTTFGFPSGTPTTKPHLHVPDLMDGGGDDTEFNQGTKDVDPITNWHWGLGPISAKTDLGNVGLLIENDCNLYFFADRFAAEGDADLGLWLFKDDVSLNPNGTFSGIHTDGDLLITSKYTNGGGDQDIRIYEWQGNNATGSLVLVYDSEVDTGLTGEQLSGTVNTAPMASCYPYQGKNQPANTYNTGTFFEAHIDICALERLVGTNFDIDLCFSNFLFKTSQSQEPTSANGDLVFGSINSIPAQKTLNGGAYCSGGTGFDITLSDVDAGVSYQLQKQNGAAWDNVGAAKTGADGSTINFDGLQLVGSYRVFATTVGTNCTAVVGTAEVTVITANGGTGGPDQTICGPSADPAVLSVTGASTGTYQWQSNTTSCADGSPWANINLATGATYDPPAGLTATTYYRRVTTVTSGETTCPATSSCITVTINNITPGTIAGNQTLCGPSADPAAFTVTVAATGTATPTYQWQSKPGTCEDGGTWTNIAVNGTGATYDAPAGLTATTSYRRIATSTVNTVACPATSNCITVTINSITPGTVAGNQTLCGPADPAAFTVTVAATGSATPTYQWQSKPGTCEEGGTWTDIAVNGTGATYDVPAGLAATTSYRRIATSTVNTVACPATSNCITVTIGGITPGSIAASQTLCGPSVDPAAFTSIQAASGPTTPTYQWQSKPGTCEDGGTWTDIATNGTGPTYDVPAGLTATTSYRRMATSTVNNVNCSAPSNCITVTVNNITPGTIAGNQTLCGPSVDPAAFTVTVAATGTATPTYQWQSKPGTCEDGGTWTNIAVNGTGATYDVPAGLTATTSYRRIATSTVNGQACPATSNCITVTINNITPGTIAGNQALCSPADPAAFTVTVAATGTATPTYQWQSKPGTCEEGGTWTNIAVNGTSATYDVPAGLTATTSYRRIATSTVNTVACPATSNCITVTVTPTPAPPFLVVVNDCELSTITAYVSSAPGAALVPAGELTWSNGMTGNPINVTATTAVTATRTVGGCPSGTSNSVTPAPVARPGAPTGVPASGCIGQQITLGASGCTGTYKWYATNISTTVLGTGSTFTTPALNENATYYVSCTVGGCEGPRTPVTASVTACGSFCTYTQGAWGTEGGKMCDGDGKGDYSTIGMLNHVLANWGGSLTVGSNGNTVTINANCILALLPGGGNSYALTGTATTCDQISAKYAKQLPKGYKINNTLLTQTITLGLNLGINDNLATFSFATHSATNKYLITQKLASCGGTSVVPNSSTCDLIDPAVIALLKQAAWPASGAGDYPATVAGLYRLANYALGGQSLAGTGVTLESIAGVVDAINNAFDGCRAFVSFSATCPSSNRMATDPIETSIVVTASPNPYSDRIRLVITSKVSGQGSVDMYNAMGQKIATPFRGYINAGRAETVEYNVPASLRGNLIYKVSVKDRFVSGKVVSLHK